MLLVALPVVVLRRNGMRDGVHVGLRVAAFALLIVALARPVQIANSTRVHPVIVVDRSGSTSGAALPHLDDLVERIADRAPPTWVVIGDVDHSTLPGKHVTIDDVSESSLSRALAMASLEIPDEDRGCIIVVSDGRATDRRWGPTVQSLIERGIPVHTCQLDRPSGDVYPTDLAVDELLRPGHSARARIRIAAHDTAAVVVRLRDGTNVIAEVGPEPCPGECTVGLDFEPPSTAFARLEVDVVVDQGGDSNPDNNTLARSVAVQDPHRVLYLGERMSSGAERLANLVGEGFDIIDVNATAEDVVGADLIVIDDRPAASLPEAWQDAIARAVVDEGAGLFYAGGQAAFGPGGYEGSKIAELLPVEFVQKEEKRDPSTTLVVIIDTSGSMGGNRVQLAKEVARLAMRRLLPHDKVGIVEFYGAKRWAAPIQPASNAIELQRALNRLDAGGGTVILPAIEEAFYGLQNVQTRYKHVVILTDGGVETGPFEPLLRSMADKGVNVSTVLVGGGVHSEFLLNLANWGKGRFYGVPDRFNLPELILKQPTSARLPAYHRGTFAVATRGGTGWWGPVQTDTAPPLSAYVRTQARDGSEVLIRTRSGDHPVLATWPLGLGRVTTLTTEPVGPGTDGWAEWDGYGQLMSRVWTRTARAWSSPLHFEISRAGSRVRISARRRGPSGTPNGMVMLGDGNEQSVEFRVRTPGYFTADVWCAPTQELRASVWADEAPQPVRLVSQAASDIAAEMQVDDSLGLSLDHLARATGGSFFRPGQGPAVFSNGGGARPLKLIKLWMVVLGLAIVTFLLDIAWRRRPQGAGTT